MVGVHSGQEGSVPGGDEAGGAEMRFEFPSDAEAIAWLEPLGFSVGRLQGPAPRGILFGSYDIQKWRNLRPSDVDALHGTLQQGVVLIWGDAPAYARAAIAKATAGETRNAEGAL